MIGREYATGPIHTAGPYGRLRDTASLTPFGRLTVHTAADRDGLIQPCARCGFVLADATTWAEGRTQVVSSLGVYDPDGPAWWPVGARVGNNTAVAFGHTYTYVLPDDRPLGPDEAYCTTSAERATTRLTREGDAHPPNGQHGERHEQPQ